MQLNRLFSRDDQASERLAEYFGGKDKNLAACDYHLQRTPYDGMLLDFKRSGRTLIYDNHKFLFALLFMASFNRRCPVTVVHVDRHWDSKASSTAMWRAQQGFVDVFEAIRFTDVVLHEGDFLTAACAAGFVKEIVFVVPASKPEVVKRNLDAFSGLTKVSHCTVLSEIEARAESTVLDIDVDYFLDDLGRSVDRPFQLDAALRVDWLSIGVALSPTHSGGIGASSEFVRHRFGWGSV